MERVVGNPAIPIRGRERGGFDDRPNWEKSGSAGLRVRFVDDCMILFLRYMSDRFSEIVCALVSSDVCVFDFRGKRGV